MCRIPAYLPQPLLLLCRLVQEFLSASPSPPLLPGRCRSSFLLPQSSTSPRSGAEGSAYFFPSIFSPPGVDAGVSACFPQPSLPLRRGSGVLAFPSPPLLPGWCMSYCLFPPALRSHRLVQEFLPTRTSLRPPILPGRCRSFF
jgi:hypothetical protein